MTTSQVPSSNCAFKEPSIDSTKKTGSVTREKIALVSLKKAWNPIPEEPIKINRVKQKTYRTVPYTKPHDRTALKPLESQRRTGKPVGIFKRSRNVEILSVGRQNIEPSLELSNKETEENVDPSVLDAQKRKSNHLKTLRILPPPHRDPKPSEGFERFDSIYPREENDFDSNNPFNSNTSNIGFIEVCRTLKKRNQFKNISNKQKNTEEQKNSELIPPKSVDTFMEKLEKSEKLFQRYEETLSMNKSTEADFFEVSENTFDESSTGDTLSFRILESISIYLTALNIVRRDYRKLLDVPLFDSENPESDHSQSLKTWLDLIEYTDRSHPLFLELFQIPASTKKSSYDNPPPSVDSASTLELTSEQQHSLSNPPSSDTSEEFFDPLKMHKILCTFFLFLKTPLLKNQKSLSLALALNNLKYKNIEFSYIVFSKTPPVIVTHFLLYSNFFIRQEIFQAVSDPNIIFTWLEQAFNNNWTDEAANEFLRTFSPPSRNSFLEYFQAHTSEELKGWILKNYPKFFDEIPQTEEVSNGCGCYCS